MNTSEDVNGDNSCCNCRTLSVIAAVVIACLIFAALVWKTREYATPPSLSAPRAAERSKALADLHAVEADALLNVGWADQAKGLVRLPIEDAKKLVEREWQDPAKARADLLKRVAKANEKPPEKPSAYE